MVQEEGQEMRWNWLLNCLALVSISGVCSHLCVAENSNASGTGISDTIPLVCMTVVIPSYMRPAASGSSWDKVIAHPLKSKRVGRIMIANPNSGPGSNAKPEYLHVITAAHQSGNKVYGYVSTRYGKVDLRIVRQEIGQYIRWYGVDGIFVDEVSADASEVARYYQPLVEFITSAIDGGGVILNAGTYPDASYAAIRVPDQSKLQIVVFEGGYASFTSGSFALPLWASRYPASLFINIVYNTPADRVTEVLQLSVKRNARSIYVTDQTMPNPYARLPSYWFDLDRAVQSGCAD
jgi:hypothetical protein